MKRCLTEMRWRAGTGTQAGQQACREILAGTVFQVNVSYIDCCGRVRKQISQVSHEWHMPGLAGFAVDGPVAPSGQDARQPGKNCDDNMPAFQ